MASSSKGKATYSSPTFYNYLDSLREEYELLKYKLDLMARDVESLRNERDEYKAQVDNGTCNRCTGRKETLSAPQVVTLSQAKTSKRLFRLKFLEKGTPFNKSQGVKLTQEITPQPTTIIPIPSSQSVSQARSLQSASSIYLQEPSVSTTGPNSGPEESGWSITFNNKVEKRFDVQIAHVLSHAKLVYCVNFSRDGRYLAAGCDSGKAHIYDVETGSLIRVLRNLFEEEEAVRVVKFSHDGTYLATCPWDGGNLYIWEVKTKYLRNVFPGHTDFILSLDCSPNGQLIVSASYDNTVRLWNMRDGTEKPLIEDNPTFIDEPHYRSAVFSPDGRYVAASHRDGMVRIWHVRTQQLIRRVQAHMDFVNDIAFMPDGKGLWSGCSDKTLRYWDTSSLYTTRSDGGSQTTNNLYEHVSEMGQHTLARKHSLEHEVGVHALAISPDGRWIASGSCDKRVRIWDTQGMQCIINHDHAVWAIDFSPVGGYLASGEHNGTVKIWRYLYIQ